MQARRRFQGSESEDTNLTTIVVDDDPHDTDKKYTKGWNLKSLSNSIATVSGNALKALIPQIPLHQESNNHLQHINTGGQYNFLSSTQTVAESNLKRENLLNSSKSSRDNLQEDDFLPSEENNIVVMTSRDRSGEFANAIRSLQSRNISRAVNVRDPRKAKQIQNYSEFMGMAKFIGGNIASTYAKLEKLTLLAKRKSLFDDRPQEIQELTYIIKGDLNALNQQIARLKDISRDQGRHTTGKHLQSHSSNMVLALQSKLANMSTNFKEILEVRTENLKQQKSRRDQFSQGPIAGGASLPPAVKQNSLLLSEENQQQIINMDMTNASGDNLVTNDETRALIPRSQLQQQQMLIYDESDNYVQQRAETMQNIECTIVELGGIFQQLAHMVKEQEEIVERIDTNIQDAELNVEAAHGEILKYFQSVTKNRWLMIKIFGVLIFFFIFFVIFVA